MIVKTLLDTDLYKFTTSYAYIKLFPYAMGTFSFNDRIETQYTEDFLKALKAEIKNLSQLRFTEEELEYMTKNCRFLPRVYWEWLSSFRFDPNKIDIHLDEACHLHIEVTDLLYKVTLYEVPLLAIVSEIKNRFFGNVADMNEILCKLSEKIELSNQHQLRFSEFGTRRRFSIDVQETVIKKLNEIILSNLSNQEFSMDDMAESLNMSRSSFYRKMKGVLDLSPNEYLRIERLKRAAQLLKEGESRINEICYMVGFNSSSYFSKCFLKQFGVLPKDFAG